MDRKEDGNTPLEVTGYDEQRTINDVVAYDAAEQHLVYATADELATIRSVDTEIDITSSSIPTEGIIEDVATGKNQKIYILGEDELRVRSTTESISDAWEVDATQIEALNKANVIVFTDSSGSIHGLDTRNRLPKFQSITFTNASGTPVTPTLVAGRTGFIAYADDTVRSYNERGNVQWEANFETEVVTIGQKHGDCVVGLADDSIHWVNPTGKSTSDIGKSLESIANIGNRLLIGSSDGSLLAFGDSGMAPRISQWGASAVTQTGDDSLIGLMSDRSMRLFMRQDPTVDIHAVDSSTDEGVCVAIEIRNPYPIPLQIELDFRGEEDEETMFLPPRRSQTKEVVLKNRSRGDEVAVKITSRDGSICVFDDTVVVTEQTSTDQITESEDASTASGDGSSSGKELVSSADSNDQTDLEVGPSENNNSHDSATAGSLSEDSNDTDDDHVDAVDSSETSEMDTLPDSAPVTADMSDNDSGTAEVSDTEMPSVSVSLDLIEIVNSSMTWKLTFTNQSDTPLTDVRIDKTVPVKFSIEGPRSVDSVESGESFTTKGSLPYRSGTVSAVIQWTDADGDDHHRSVQENISLEFFEAHAKKQILDDNTEISRKVEFTLINHLDAPVSESVTISAIQSTGSRRLGQYDITLMPGTNVLTKFFSEQEELANEQITSYEVNLSSLPVSTTVDVIPALQELSRENSDKSFLRSVGIYQNINNKVTKHIESVRPKARRTDRFVERLTVKNSSDSWTATDRLWTNIDGKWTATDELLPSLHSGQKIRLKRHWQRVGGVDTLKTQFPAHRLGKDGPTISTNEYKTTRPKITMYAASVPLAPDGEYVLLLVINNHWHSKIKLTDFCLENEPWEKYTDPYPISVGRTHLIQPNVTDTYNLQTYSGLVKAKFESNKRRTIRDAVVTKLDYPLMDDSNVWFRADCEERTEDKYQSVTLTIHNKRPGDTVEEVTLQPQKTPGVGASTPTLSPGNSIGVHTQIDTAVSERQRLAEIYEVSAIVDGTEQTEYVRLQPTEGDSNSTFTASILPTVETIDVDKMLETWPDQVATNWRYES